MSRTRHDLLLESAGSELVRRLGGTWSDRGGMCCCPAHADKTPSLSVRVGDRSLLFKCFAGCDTLDVLRSIRALHLTVPSAPNPPSNTEPDPRAARLADLAQNIWDRSRSIAGTIAERYLLARHLPSAPAALRFHPSTPLGRGRAVRFRPAMIAAVHERGRLVAVQRSFLDTATGWLASDLEKPKRTLGRPLGGAVVLSQPSYILGLAEGVETAMSASMLLGIPVWATLGTERFARITIPESVDRLILLPDNDPSGRVAERQARIAYARPGRAITTEWPWYRQNDWNAVLRFDHRKQVQLSSAA